MSRTKSIPKNATFLTLSLKRRIDSIVDAHLAMNSYRGFFHDAAKRRAEAQMFRAADEALKRLQPFLAQDDRVPNIRVSDGESQFFGPATSYLARGHLAWIASWLEAHIETGRPDEYAMAHCAREIAALFEKEFGRPDWRAVGEIVYRAFGNPIVEHKRLGAYKLVKRHFPKPKKPSKVIPLRRKAG